MAALRVNILANYAGQMWVAAMGIVFLPAYIRLLGIEAFGLVGLMLSLQSILQLFDFGIGGTTNRELSRRAHDPALANGARDLVRTTEALIWLLAIAATALLWTSSGLVAEHWLNIETLTINEAGRALSIMAVAIGLLWPSTFYAQCLAGLEKHSALSQINVVFATLRYGGAVPVLVYVEASISAFLLWNVVVGAAQSLVSAAAVWAYMPAGSRREHLSFKQLHSTRHFAGGLFAISLLAVAITQLDRLTLTSLRPLEDLGYYTLALSVAAGMGRMVLPLFNAIYPRFSRLVATGDMDDLNDLYRLSSQLMAVVTSSMAAVLVLFSDEVLLLWTGDAHLAGQVALPMALLAVGTALNGLMNVPYALQLAHGWTRLAVQMNAIALTVGVPLCVWSVGNHGLAGAALPWLTINLGFMAIGLPLMHRRLRRGQLRQWYTRDIAPPVGASVASASLLAFLLPSVERSLEGAALLALASMVTVTASASMASGLRRYARQQLQRRIPK